MICYKDMTFCNFESCKKFKECNRALTKNVKDNADKWWGFGFRKAPICIFLNKPKCYEVVK